MDITKFVTFAITCIFILLVFGVPGHNQFSPTWCYIAITVAYYILTEPWTHENATKWLAWFQVEFFENLEVLWAPVLIRLFSSFISGKNKFRRMNESMARGGFCVKVVCLLSHLNMLLYLDQVVNSSYVLLNPLISAIMVHHT